MSKVWDIEKYRQHLRDSGQLKDTSALPWEKAEASGNKKVRNARRVRFNGIKFDSELEKYCYSSLTLNQIEFILKPKYVLQEAFTFGEEKIEPIEMFPDFYLPAQHALVDTKGWMTDVFLLKAKILKRILLEVGNPPLILLPQSPKEVDWLIYRIRYNIPLLQKHEGLAPQTHNGSGPGRE